MNRRHFLHTFGSGLMLTSVGAFPLRALANEPELLKLTILHTNDVHSRIEPFPMDGSRNQGMGGAARRAALIRKIRQEESHVLLFDSGDIFQGTPYFNVYGGELEFKLMSEMRYDAATIGNHDFDAGMEGLHKQLPHANFPFISSNYDFSNTIMNGKTLPYKIFQVEQVKIGVLAVGIELEGLVPKALYEETRYLDPVANANRVAAQLKNDEKCDYIICLSHLGYKYYGDKVSDMTLASNSRDIDLILGGHTHTFLDQPDVVSNLAGRPVLVNQAGWAGIMLGRLDIFFERNRKNRCESCQNIFVTAGRRQG
ncbi:MAG TPA: metallophosphatase [Saprospiraceae bacterium]|nr:metallophosphatase [Saprospiraceae bacterium]HMP25082.1 metallophosphatase [Saprospiraceae bacterium]